MANYDPRKSNNFFTALSLYISPFQIDHFFFTLTSDYVRYNLEYMDIAKKVFKARKDEIFPNLYEFAQDFNNPNMLLYNEKRDRFYPYSNNGLYNYYELRMKRFVKRFLSKKRQKVKDKKLNVF